jgi:hypothetical protein
MLRFFVCLAVLMSIAGCETSAVWYASHPQRQTVSIDGLDVNVVPRRDGEFDAWGGDEGTKTSMPSLKARQIRAVETVSRCKVTDAEYMPGTWTLQTRVKC